MRPSFYVVHRGGIRKAIAGREVQSLILPATGDLESTENWRIHLRDPFERRVPVNELVPLVLI